MEMLDPLHDVSPSSARAMPIVRETAREGGKRRRVVDGDAALASELGEADDRHRLSSSDDLRDELGPQDRRDAVKPHDDDDILDTSPYYFLEDGSDLLESTPKKLKATSSASSGGGPGEDAVDTQKSRRSIWKKPSQVDGASSADIREETALEELLEDLRRNDDDADVAIPDSVSSPKASLLVSPDAVVVAHEIVDCDAVTMKGTRTRKKKARRKGRATDAEAGKHHHLRPERENDDKASSSSSRHGRRHRRREDHHNLPEYEQSGPLLCITSRDNSFLNFLDGEDVRRRPVMDIQMPYSNIRAKVLPGNFVMPTGDDDSRSSARWLSRELVVTSGREVAIVRIEGAPKPKSEDPKRSRRRKKVQRKRRGSGKFRAMRWRNVVTTLGKTSGRGHGKPAHGLDVASFDTDSDSDSDEFLIASAGHDGAAMLWLWNRRRQKGRQVAVLQDPPESCYDLKVFPEWDYKVFVAGGPYGPRNDPHHGGELISQFQRARDDPKSVAVAAYDALSGKGGRSVGDSEMTRIAPFGHLCGHSSHVNGLDGDVKRKILFTCSGDRSVKLWSVASGKEVASLPLVERGFSVLFVPETNYVLVGTFHSMVQIWDIRQHCRATADFNVGPRFCWTRAIDRMSSDRFVSVTHSAKEEPEGGFAISTWNLEGKMFGKRSVPDACNDVCCFSCEDMLKPSLPAVSRSDPARKKRRDGSRRAAAPPRHEKMKMSEKEQIVRLEELVVRLRRERDEALESLGASQKEVERLRSLGEKKKDDGEHR